MKRYPSRSSKKQMIERLNPPHEEEEQSSLDEGNEMEISFE